VKSFSSRGYAELKGIIYNARNIEDEDKLVKDAAKEIGTDIIVKMNRDPIVQKAESVKKTVVEFDPDSDMAQSYAKLADYVMGDSDE